MLRITTTLIFMLFAAAATADTAIGELVDQEHRTLGAIPDARLATYLTAPKGTLGSTANEVGYSREWVAAQPVAKGGAEWRCLSEALYFEARGESIKGQFAVAEVILNRVDSPRFPDTVCGVIHQGTGRKFACQFTYTCDGRKEIIAEPKAFKRVGKIAKLMVDGAKRELTDGATYYHTRAVSPRWSRKFKRTTSIGQHHFYRPQTRVSMN